MVFDVDMIFRCVGICDFDWFFFLSSMNRLVKLGVCGEVGRVVRFTLVILEV